MSYFSYIVSACLRGVIFRTSSHVTTTTTTSILYNRVPFLNAERVGTSRVAATAAETEATATVEGAAAAAATAAAEFLQAATFPEREVTLHVAAVARGRVAAAAAATTQHQQQYISSEV